MLGRILLATLALLLAISAGALTLMGGVLLDPALRETFGRLGLAGLLAGLTDLAAGLPPDMAALILAFLAQALALLVVLPPVLAALIGALFGLRSALWYGGACAGLTAALPWLARGAILPTGPAAAAEARLSVLLLATGAASGLTYWLIAGRSAGARRPEP
ncbi:hypothetical protein ASG52_11820 [Methylobacterium sp. Leaf456]|uniref:hypothetical protein n=1 Tax=Methylobacterium sp. Leaf456 TaxID=1736382 RepID=UPI0006F540CB|nr:hypothetical protein [Methylobacterium sp. Leaf456]KQT46420.1 hypothetical protein ASG52_11820 [Methylobacterium sp. Leaf456]